MSDAAHPAPHKNRVSLALLLFGAAAAPLFWLGQLMLGYGVTAMVCYPADRPQQVASSGPWGALLISFDAVAIIAAAAGGVVSLWCFARVRHEKGGGAHHALGIGEGRARFMALWGIFSSLWFFCAILFNVIASVMVPLCLH